jgi:hypothetical protein
VTFTAGQQPGDIGTVKIEQIGRRGIGRASLTFTVRPRNLSASISGDYTATGLGNTMVVHVELTVDLVRDSATGDYEVIDAPAAVAATFSGPGCTADFAGEDPIAITVVADEADRDLFRLSVDANAAATTTHTITCPSVSLPISSFITLWASAIQSVELRIGTAATVPTEVTQGQGSIIGAAQITLLERA